MQLYKLVAFSILAEAALATPSHCKCVSYIFYIPVILSAHNLLDPK